ncbi:MAG: ABC transporter substrate-binding protein [Firmicutes bacterium]|nr:ABC transporter substrate-binding protein [Bacillota bacterium]
MKRGGRGPVFFFRAAAVFLLFCLSFYSGGCRVEQKEGGEARGPAAPVVVRDDSGALLEFTGFPKRIVSLAPSNTEILFALGLENRVVGVTTYCDYPPAARRKTKVGDLQANIEQIVALKPDLVLAKWTLNKDAVIKLRKLKIPVLCVEPESMEGVYRAILMVAQVTGTEDAGRRIVERMKSKINEVQRKLAGLTASQRPKVFIEVGDDPLFTAGSGTFIDELVRLAGGINIAGDLQGYQMYSSEAVVEKNPDIILAPDSYYVDVGRVLKKRPGWEQIKAVKNNRIISQLDPNLINRPGPRAAEAVEAIAKAFYPEIFPEKARDE